MSNYNVQVVRWWLALGRKIRQEREEAWLGETVILNKVAQEILTYTKLLSHNNQTHPGTHMKI